VWVRGSCWCRERGEKVDTDRALIEDMIWTGYIHEPMMMDIYIPRESRESSTESPHTHLFPTFPRRRTFERLRIYFFLVSA